MHFFQVLFSNYDVTSELMMLTLNLLLLLVMIASKPKKTRMFKLAAVTSIFSFASIIVHIILLGLTCYPTYFLLPLFNFVYILYLILYITILNLLYAYVNLMSYKRRNHLNKVVYNILGFTVVYLIVGLFPVVSGKLLFYTDSGAIRFTDWQYSIYVCGIICCGTCFVSSIINRKNITRIMYLGMILTLPLDAFILAIQFHFDTAYFISFTYVAPIIVIYTLFHSYRYDDVIGCQNIDAMESVVTKAIRMHKNYVVMNVVFPQIEKRRFSDMEKLIQDASSKMCRKIERINKKVRIYSDSIYSYSLFCEIENYTEGEQLSESVKGIFSVPITFAGRKFKPVTKFVVIMNNPYIDSFAKLKSFSGYLRNSMNPDSENDFYIATRWDVDRFKIYYDVENAVIDIRSKFALDDPRIEVYIQPIHCIATNSFRTGEALMRMSLNGKIISPELVVSVAEGNNCIHAITVIMLNKVCKKIKELENGGYDFDAITVNCSTLELADVDFHNEVMEIIEANGINPGHVRLEITESTAITNYRNILNNMLLLNGYGISFYLDDFGTGYSNLERISRYPFQTIKFDKSILYSALKNKNSEMLMRTLVWYFRKNNFHTVIEGVEDQAQYEYCKKIGFEYVQGYLFSNPIPAHKITEYFTKR